MADCCKPGTGFPTAPQMEQLATNLPIVWEEICLLQQAILSASSLCSIDGGKMCTVVAGNTPMTFVTGVDSVTVDSGGSGYLTDEPALEFIPPLGGPGAGATGTIVRTGGVITGINITSGGSGYQPISATMSISSFAGFGGVFEPLVNAAGNIVGVNIVSGGSAYVLGDSITATRAVAPAVGYVNAVFQITSISLTGEVLEVAILNPGSGYQDSVAEVKIVSTLNPALDYPQGTGFFGTVLTDLAGTITQVVVDNGGVGYTDYPPYLVITDPGTGAVTEVNLTGTSVSSIDVISSGNGYTTGALGDVFNPPTAALPNPPASPAVVTINTAVNTFGTNPNLYWQVFTGATTNKPIQLQLNSVISYFKGLGYTIQIQTNPNTGSTIQWKICW